MLPEPFIAPKLLATADAYEILAGMNAAAVLAQALHSLVGLLTKGAIKHSLPSVVHLLVAQQVYGGGESEVAVVTIDSVLFFRHCHQLFLFWHKSYSI